MVGLCFYAQKKKHTQLIEGIQVLRASTRVSGF